jgi:hypothetical protein
MYGHRLSDATSPSGMPQHPHDETHYGQPQYSQQQPLPQSASVSTLRPSYPDGYTVSADDVTRPLSSMSNNGRPVMVEQSQDPYQTHYTHAPPFSAQSYTSGPSTIPPSTSVDQFGRPAPPPHSYSALPALSHNNSHFAAQTPPPPPNSAPPSSAHQQQGYPNWAGPPQQQSSLPPAPLHSIPPGRPLSAADMTAPNRPLSSNSYHALPQPPVQQQQQQHEHAIYHQPQEQGHYQYAIASPADYSQPSYPSSHAPQMRPLPPSAMAPSASSSFAPPGPPQSYYPPPAQTPSHYVGPPPTTMPWSNQPGVAAAPYNSTYSSYPPPPPGPSNGDYVHAGPIAASPSTHPGQYPPPPPMHHVDYGHHPQQQPYYAQSPNPPPQGLPPAPQQQQTQTYYHHPQAQHPY